MSYQFTHEKLKAWQLAKALAKRVYQITSDFPGEERFGLVNQIRRASVSVMSNLAEGSGRTGSKDQAHFSQMAYGSLMELDSQLQLSVDLGFIHEPVYLDIRNDILELSATINALRTSQLKRATS